MTLPTKILTAAIPAIAFALVLSGPLKADPSLSRKEKKTCKVCHTDPRNGALNDTGTYYKEHRKLPPPPPADPK